MDNILQYIKVPFFFAEILKLVVGLNFLFVINLLSKPEIYLIPNFSYTNDVVKIIFLTTISYFLGRLFLLVANIWDGLICLLIRKERFIYLKNKYIKFVNIVNGESETIRNENKIGYEIEEYIEKNKFQKDLSDRNYYYRHFLGLTIGACIVLSFFSPSYMVSIGLWSSIFILTLVSISDQVQIHQTRRQIAQHIIKEKSKQ